MIKGIKKLVRYAAREANEEISALGRGGGIYGRGLASEGYNGGYRQALYDVSLLMNGCLPNSSSRAWWRSAKEKMDMEAETRRIKRIV